MLHQVLAGCCASWHHSRASRLAGKAIPKVTRMMDVLGCRSLESLGRTEASLQTALREVAVLAALVGGKTD
jgi:hypothetical protein